MHPATSTNTFTTPLADKLLGTDYQVEWDPVRSGKTVHRDTLTGTRVPYFFAVNHLEVEWDPVRGRKTLQGDTLPGTRVPYFLQHKQQPPPLTTRATTEVALLFG